MKKLVIASLILMLGCFGVFAANPSFQQMTNYVTFTNTLGIVQLVQLPATVAKMTATSHITNAATIDFTQGGTISSISLPGTLTNINIGNGVTVEQNSGKITGNGSGLNSIPLATNALQLGGNDAANFVSNNFGGDFTVLGTVSANTFSGSNATLQSATFTSSNVVGPIKINNPVGAITGASNIVTTNLTVAGNQTNTGNLYVGGNQTNAGTITSGAISSSGTVSATSGLSTLNSASLTIPAGAYVTWNAVGNIIWPSSGVIRLAAQTEASFRRLDLGPASASWPAFQVTNNASVTLVGGDGVAGPTNFFTASGFSSTATNTLTFTTVSSCTNTLPQGDGTASLSAGTAVVLQDRFGNTVDTIGTVATLHVLIPMRANMRLSGTGISCVMY